MGGVRVVLISTYELGRQPFGLASPAAWLRAAGHQVNQVDLSRGPLPAEPIEAAELIAFYLPMHTATRLFLRVIGRVRAANPQARLCAYGLYAPLNETLLRRNGIDRIIGGEFEQPLLDLAGNKYTPREGSLPRPDALISLDRQDFLPPDRSDLPPLASYARLAVNGGTRVAGYTEASRGCKHLCRHCPVVPVYRGRFRIVQPEVVLEDIRRQLAGGAQHITFGDPDFLNGPAHAVRVVEGLHAEWPELTYDVTVKIEHLLKHREILPLLKSTGCLFVTSAVESFDDAVLATLAKGHTQRDFLEALGLMRAAGLALSPTFIPFTPWTTRASYRDFLRTLLELDLVSQVAPIQVAIRLLIPEGSLLLDLPEIRGRIEPFDQRGLCYPWRNLDPWLDELSEDIQRAIQRGDRRRASRAELFRQIWDLAECGDFPDLPLADRATIPYLTEPWYC
jgi:radical SAM superfamily enzyme YgiQ (UPF0313 family)